MYLSKKKQEIVKDPKVFLPEDFGGWQALNIGTSIAIVDGVPLDPNGIVVGVDFSDLHPEVKWGDPITISFTGAGTNRVLFTRLKYTKI